MDASKVMAAAFYYDGDPWDMIYHGQPHPYIPARALPIITVPTLAATGSEMNMGAVISNQETKEKSFVQGRMSISQGCHGGPRTHGERTKESDRLWGLRPAHSRDRSLLQRR
ncbi:hypothetical protein DAMNIGENAA_30540 [Desulforhabdus amnigena]|uniref:Alcohol dehydrogenase iron-type/glycerol dehydrogenase GldA domain-containing protein n=1 Tax=Desulforhabdus amnigena TaxID=40218 RepID=A0A9W6FVF3_9BACT|nr:hypothetical protein DAMNIGENAA_30540 [Desulforhabdus amnigena]